MALSRNLAAMLLIAAAFMSSTLVTPLYELYRRQFHFSEVALTLIYAVYVVGNLFALLFFGRLSDRIGRRRVALPAIVLACGSTILFVFAGATIWLFGARLLSGFAVGLASATGTAWLADLYGAGERLRATLSAICANLTGAAIGPALAGLLAQYAPYPLHLPFWVYFAVLTLTGVLVARAPETVRTTRPTDELPWFMPRIGVPKETRSQFVAPAVTALGIWALAGFYFALLPGVLSRDLGERNLSVAGAVVFEMMAVSLFTTLLTRSVKSETAMLLGLTMQVPSVAILVLAQAMRSMPVLLLGSAVTGAALGLGYRGSLQVVNDIAPENKRAAVVSAYFSVIFIGNSVPIIGIGVISALSSPLVANMTFATVIASFSVVTILRTVRRGREMETAA